MILSIIGSVWFLSIASSPVVTGAKVRLDHKKYEETVKLLEENKAEYPNDPELFYYLARAYAGIANWEKAGENFSAALEKNPPKNLRKEVDKWRDHHWATFVKEATALLQQKRFPEAIAKYRIANSINPERKESQSNLAVALLEQGQLYIDANPPNPDSAKVLFDEAIERFKIAIKLDPEDDQFVKNLGQAYIAADKPGEAIDLYEKFLEDNPDDPSVLRRLVTIYMSQRDYENAARIYDDIFADAASEISTADAFNAGSCYYQLYITYSKKEDQASKDKASELLTKAGDCYSQVLKEDPTDCEAGTQLYYIYIYSEQWQKVVDTIELMFANNCPRDHGTLQNLGVAYMKIDNKDKAIEIWKEAEALKNKEKGSESK